MKDISKDSKISDNNLKDVNGGNGMGIPIEEDGVKFPAGSIVYLRDHGNEQFIVKGSLFDYGCLWYWVAPVCDLGHVINQYFSESDLSYNPF